MRFLALPTSLLLGVTLQSHIAAALQNDFSAYPEGSQQCLSDAADTSQCSGNTGQQLNQCLCKNRGNFIYDTAQCVAKASPNDLGAVYDTMENNCSGTGVTIAVSKDAFMSQALAATETSSAPTPSATGGHSSGHSGGGGLSTGEKIGMGAGLGLGIVAAGLAAWFIYLYSKRLKSKANAANASPDAASHRDVELSHSNLNSPMSPAPEYAQHNMQFGAVEIAQSNREYKELPADYYDSGSKTDHKRTSDVPLLRSEMAADEPTRAPTPSPAYAFELPGDMVYNDTSRATTPVSASHEQNEGQSRRIV